MSRRIASLALALAAVVALGAACDARAELAVRDGDKIVFLGDSITRYGAQPVGYVSLVMDGLERAGVKATAINAGIPGDKSNQMLARLPPLGNVVMAEGVLRAFGVDAASLARARAAWVDLSGADTVTVPLTYRQRQALTALAHERYTTVQRLLQPMLQQFIADFLRK